ncbi:MAG: hypothetical protein IJV35_07385 [Neisseriaceae bacterium]|nr:hypothetical protein [Neisseriaceae bacterium]MBQ9683071.1 hypothetical protein [Neisseriaceae bacterium]
MSYAVKKENLATMQSSYALARKAEQNYREMINAQLLHSLERMSQDDYQAEKMPDNFHVAVLERIKANKGE